jgi:hypothetical protein
MTDDLFAHLQRLSQAVFDAEAAHRAVYTDPKSIHLQKSASQGLAWAHNEWRLALEQHGHGMIAEIKRLRGKA